MRLIDADAFRREIDNHWPFTKEEQSKHGIADMAKSTLLCVLNQMPSVQPERTTCQICHALTADEIESLKKKLLEDAPIVLLPSTLPEIIMPLEPERKKGTWIQKSKPMEFCTEWWYECSECGGKPPRDRYGNSDYLSNYCPNCGARMAKEGEE